MTRYKISLFTLAVEISCHILQENAEKCREFRDSDLKAMQVMEKENVKDRDQLSLSSKFSLFLISILLKINTMMITTAAMKKRTSRPMMNCAISGILFQFNGCAICQDLGSALGDHRSCQPDIDDCIGA